MIAFPNQPTPDPRRPAVLDMEPHRPSPAPVSGGAGASSLTTSSSLSATSPSGAVSPFLANDTERLGDEIARLAAHIHAATYRLLVLIRVFDEQEGWAWGFRSCAEWLSWRTGIAPGAAREKVRAAKALGPLPKISGAMARGELSYSKVRAMTRVASEANEDDLLEVARHATAAHVERLVRAWRKVDRLEDAEKESGGGAGAEAEADAEAEAERHRSRYLQLYPAEDGMYELRGRLDPEVGALLEKALDWAGEALYRKEAREDKQQTGPDIETTHGQRWADALGLAVERALAGVGPEGESNAEPASDSALSDAATASTSSPSRDATTPIGRAGRFQIVLHVEEMRGKRDPSRGEDDSRKKEIEDSGPGPKSTHVPAGTSGLSVPPETTKRLACDAGLIQMTHDSHGTVLNVGRKRRTVPPAIRRALDYRDGGCRFPGCGCRYSDAHHIVHWADGGETKLENLILLCRRHHRLVHEEGFRVELAQTVRSEGKAGLRARTGAGVRGPHSFQVSFFRPDGQPFPEVPEPPPIPGAPARAMMKGNRARDVDPGPWTPTPLWHGEALDLGLVIDMFRGLEKGRAREE